MKDAAVNDELWQTRAAAWELAALSLRYPGAELAGAAAGGEWDEAAQEILAALGLPAEVPAAAGDPDFASLAAGGAACPPAAGAAGAGGAASPGASGSAAAGSAGPHVPPAAMGEGSAPGAAVPAGADALLRALRPEATRLFVGAPEPACSPYEGVWAAEADGVQPLLFVNPRSMEVERFVKACGLGRPEGTNEPLDHIATECELLEHLALRASGAGVPEGAPADADLPGGSPQAAYGAFLQEHARTWMPAFAGRLAAETRHPFYRAAAAYLGALVG